MKFYIISLLLIISTTGLCQEDYYKSDYKTLEIGSKAPDFKLKGVDKKNYSLKSFNKAEVLAIVFTCNHCPTAQAYEDRLIKIASEYKDKKVQVVAISTNDPKAVRLDELGYTDLNDGYEDMQIRSIEKKFPFPYLYDGDKQDAGKKFGPIATPHIFIFDKQRVLRYQGRIDDVENPYKTPTENNAIQAIESILQNKPISKPKTKVFGCSIKWSSKGNWKEEYEKKWRSEDVVLKSIDANGIKELIKNNSDKVRLINVWATWCGPCVKEFPDLIEIYRMYGHRDFELITISADDISKENKVYNFLRKENASNTNFIYSSSKKYDLIDAIDEKWDGALPYTIIIEPGGKKIYSKMGTFNPLVLKKIIVESKVMGRFF